MDTIVEMSVEDYEAEKRRAMDRKQECPILVMEMSDEMRENFSDLSLDDIRKRGMYGR